MAKANNYYYDQLNKEQQRAYYAMKEGLLNLKDFFPVPMLSNKELSDIYFLIRMDCPEIFYSVTFTYKFYPDSSAVEMTPQYLFTKDKIKEHRKKLKISQEALAQKSGVSLGSIKRFETKYEISLQSFIKIAIALDLDKDIETLFTQKTYNSINEVINGGVNG